MGRYRDFKDYHIGKLRDPEEARVYLSVALEEYEEDGDAEAFLLALRDVAETITLCLDECYSYRP